MKYILIAALVILSGPAISAGIYDFRAGTYQNGSSGSSKPSGDLTAMAKAAVKSQMLVDPDRVRFRNVNTVSRSSGDQVVCGEYNPINLGGNYQGYSKFAYSAQGVVLASQKRAKSGIKSIDDEFESSYRNALSVIRSMGCS